MSKGYIVIGILMFAVVTAILYVWGLRKSVTQQQDLMTHLRNKCAGIVVKAMKKRGELNEREITELITGVKSGEFWSKKKAAVSKPKEFAKQELIPFMEDQLLIRKTETGWKLR